MGISGFRFGRYYGPGVILYAFSSTGNWIKHDILWILLQISYSQKSSFYFYQPHQCPTIFHMKYILIFSKIVLILGFGIQGIAFSCSYFPLGCFVIAKSILHVIIWTFLGLLSNTIINDQFFIDIFFRALSSIGRSKGEFRGTQFRAGLHFSNGRIDIGVSESYQILIIISPFIFSLLRLYKATFNHSRIKWVIYIRNILFHNLYFIYISSHYHE